MNGYNLAQEGKLTEPEPEPSITPLTQILETSRKMEETRNIMAATAAFKPRTLWEDGGVPRRGKPENYSSGTPERALVQFLTWWQSSNYGKMATSITTIGKYPTKPADLRAWFGTKNLVGFEITNVVDQAIARSVVSVCLHVKSPHQEWKTNVEVALTKNPKLVAKKEFETCAWTFFNYYDLARAPKNGGS